MTNSEYSYKQWLFDIVCKDLFSKHISYNRLLSYLSHREFVVIIPNDVNRAEDGADLRLRYQALTGEYIDRDKPCSVLEMMIALSIRCEESIMDNPAYGDRTAQWFWGMIKNLGLYTMTDDRFDVEYVSSVVNQFLNRDYAPNGEGGLFKINNCKYDLRKIEIWYQLCWYLDRFV